MVEDAEGFQRAAMELERIGQLLPDDVHAKPPDKVGLEKYREHLVTLAATSPLSTKVELDCLFNLIKAARNDAVHEGAFARHMAARLMEFLLILEDALMIPMSRVKDRMVHEPMTAQPWHLVAHVRNAMLANAFSYMPYLLTDGSNSSWVLISDQDLVMFAAPWLGEKERRKRIKMRVAEAISGGLLKYKEATCVNSLMTLKEVAEDIDHKPVLVIEEFGNVPQLVGILTVFDLL